MYRTIDRFDHIVVYEAQRCSCIEDGSVPVTRVLVAVEHPPARGHLPEALRTAMARRQVKMEIEKEGGKCTCQRWCSGCDA